MAKYLRYVLKNIEPIRIADDATSQNGQTNTLRYIPGSTIRGFIISKLASKGKLEQYKSILFSEQICFLNAYLTTKEHQLIPSLKGFYEDKTVVAGEKEITNLFTANNSEIEGKKRAALGRYCYLEKGCIHYFNVDVESDLKININSGEKQNVFRTEKMSAGQYFEGYIRLSETELDNEVKEILNTNRVIKIGNDRSTGLGKCKMFISEEYSTIPYCTESYETKNSCYMVLLSDTTMRNQDGEYCGLDEKKLEQLLGINQLTIDKASTSVKVVKGYNRTWKTKLPSVVMYEAGSVFRLSYDGVITKESMEKIENSGIGIRKNEGYGRVIFLKDFDSLKSKLAHDYTYSEKEAIEIKFNNLSKDEKETIVTAAKGYYQIKLEEELQKYIVNTKADFGNISKSKLGVIESILTMNQYKVDEVKNTLEKFFKHELSKENNQKTQKDKASIKAIQKEVNSIMECDINKKIFGDKSEIMGIPISKVGTKEETDKFKVKLLIEWIRFSRKEN